MIGTELQHEVSRFVDFLRINALFHKEVQPTLRQYVTDKSFPLMNRFQVWETYCNKKHRVLARGEFGIIGDVMRNMVHDCKPYGRYCTYTWKNFLSYIENEPEEFNVTVEQFKELLIEANFGSFVVDW